MNKKLMTLTLFMGLSVSQMPLQAGGISSFIGSHATTLQTMVKEHPVYSLVAVGSFLGFSYFVYKNYYDDVKDKQLSDTVEHQETSNALDKVPTAQDFKDKCEALLNEFRKHEEKIEQKTITQNDTDTFTIKRGFDDAINDTTSAIYLQKNNNLLLFEIIIHVDRTDYVKNIIEIDSSIADKNILETLNNSIDDMIKERELKKLVLSEDKITKENIIELYSLWLNKPKLTGEQFYGTSIFPGSKNKVTLSFNDQSETIQYDKSKNIEAIMQEVEKFVNKIFDNGGLDE